MPKAEWRRRPRSASIPPAAVEAIARRRRQMLIHSFLYYRMDSPVIEDHVWTHWAQQLYRLQQKFGHRIHFYDDMFEDWNGSSGFHLVADIDVINVARRIHDEARAREWILS